MYITIISQLNWTYGFFHDFPMMLVDHFRLAPLAPLGDPGVRGDPRLYTPMGCGTLLMRDPLDPSRVCKSARYIISTWGLISGNLGALGDGNFVMVIALDITRLFLCY
jgi:hypothetical protein